MFMILYSLLLALGLVLSVPWWLWRMATSGRYRDGLWQRLGEVPPNLAEIALRRQRLRGVIWIHAVSVGEVLACERLIEELTQRLGPYWAIVVSTTTSSGQELAQARFRGLKTFYFPLDFAFAIRPYLRSLRPSLMVLVESEFWPRHLVECQRAGVPVAVVNARVSDRSFPRYMTLRWLWKPLLGQVSLFLAQGEESAERLIRIGVKAERVKVGGNLKYDLGGTRRNTVAEQIRDRLKGRRLVVAGSTLPGEEDLVLEAWPAVSRGARDAVLVIAPRHPERFEEVMRTPGFSRIAGYRGTWTEDVLVLDKLEEFENGSVIVLDTVGDLAAVYEFSSAVFVGGSLVPKGGHNPLEAARFGIPVAMGPSYENFREIVEGMRAAEAIRIVEPGQLGTVLSELLKDDGGMGERARRFFEAQSGATHKTVDALLGLLRA